MHIEERPVHVDRVVTVQKPRIVERVCGSGTDPGQDNNAQYIEKEKPNTMAFLHIRPRCDVYLWGSKGPPSD